MFNTGYTKAQALLILVDIIKWSLNIQSEHRKRGLSLFTYSSQNWDTLRFEILGFDYSNASWDEISAHYEQGLI